MREVSYKLADGTVTKSYAVAEASGKPYTTMVTKVPETSKIDEGLRQRRAEKHGWAQQ